MSDARLRDLERLARASGDPDDEDAWLAARVRAGELRPEGALVERFLRDARLAYAGRRVEPRARREALAAAGHVQVGFLRLLYQRLREAGPVHARVRDVTEDLLARRPPLRGPDLLVLVEGAVSSGWDPARLPWGHLVGAAERLAAARGLDERLRAVLRRARASRLGQGQDGASRAALARLERLLGP